MLQGMVQIKAEALGGLQLKKTSVTVFNAGLLEIFNLVLLRLAWLS